MKAIFTMLLNLFLTDGLYNICRFVDNCDILTKNKSVLVSTHWTRWIM